MSNFLGRIFSQEAEAQLKSLTEIQRLILQGVDPYAEDLVTSVDGDFVIDLEGNLLRWE